MPRFDIISINTIELAGTIHFEVYNCLHLACWGYITPATKQFYIGEYLWDSDRQCFGDTIYRHDHEEGDYDYEGLREMIQRGVSEIY